MRAGTSRPIVASEEPLSLGHYCSRLAWLREVPVATDFHRLLAIGRQRVSCERDDWNVIGRRVMLEDLCRFPSVDDGNRDIHEDEIRSLRSGLADALFAVERFRDGIAEVP